MRDFERHLSWNAAADVSALGGDFTEGKSPPKIQQHVNMFLTYYFDTYFHQPKEQRRQWPWYTAQNILIRALIRTSCKTILAFSCIFCCMAAILTYKNPNLFLKLQDAAQVKWKKK